MIRKRNKETYQKQKSYNLENDLKRKIYKMFNQIKIKMRNKRIIKILILIITSALVISPFTSCESLAFGDNGKFIKLKNVPLGQPVYYSPAEIFFPKGCIKGEDCKNATAKIYNIETQHVIDLNIKIKQYNDYCLLIPLKDSRILIVGGKENQKPIKNAAIYNINTNELIDIGKTVFEYNSLNANFVELNDGRIFLQQGSHIEIFNPASNKFAIAGSVRKFYPKNEQYYVLDSKPYIYFITDGNTAKLKDRETGKIIELTDKNEIKKYSRYIDEAKEENKPFDISTLNAYYRTKISKLNDGRVYIVGTIYEYKDDLRAEIYDPQKNKSVSANCPKDYLRNIVTLSNGKVLFISGDLYDPTSNNVFKTSLLNFWRDDFNAVLLSNGNVLIAGGMQFLSGWVYKPKLPMEIYDFSKDEYKNLHKKILSNSKVINLGDNTVFIKATIRTGMDEYYLYKY